MNAKKAKAIRRYVRSLGATKAKLPRPRSGVISHTDPITRQEFRYDLPLTACYPQDSFQRVYSAAKRMLRDIPAGQINFKAGLRAAGLTAA